MKLHLPKTLLTAVLAAVMTYVPCSWAGNWGNNGSGGTANSVYYVGASEDTVDATKGNQAGITTLYLAQAVDGNNASGSQAATINTLKLKDGDTMTVETHPWKNGTANFSLLTIGSLIFQDSDDEDNIGKGIFNVNAEQTVQLNGLSGSITNSTVQGTLNIAADNSTIGNLGLQNGGNLSYTDGTHEVNKFDIHNLGSSTTETLTISGATVTVTGSDQTEFAEGQNFNTQSGAAVVTLGHWHKGTGKIVVGGDKTSIFNVLTGTIRMSYDSSSILDITENGTVNVKHIQFSNTADDDAVINLNGGRLNLGEGGITANVERRQNGRKRELNLISGTLGALAENVSIAAGTTTVSGEVAFDTDIVNAVGEKTNAVATLEFANQLIVTNSGALTIAGGGKVALTGGIALGGSLTNNAELVLGGLTISSGGQGITNTGILNLSNLAVNVQALSGLKKTENFTLSDGENGYITNGGYILVQNNGGAVKADSLGVSIGGIASAVTNESGTISFATSDKLYLVNTTASYNSGTMGGMEKFLVASGVSLNTKDASILSKVIMEDNTSRTYFQNEAGTNLLSFSGTMGSTGLNLTADGTTVTASDDKTGFTGNITVLTGTTLKANHNQGLGTIYKDDKNRSITVQNGAFYDVNGKESYYHVILEDGATIKNTGGNITTGLMALPYLELKGDAFIDNGSSSQMLMQKAGNNPGEGPHKLALGNHTLTKTGDGAFIVYKGITLESNGGTIVVEGGAFEVVNDAGWSGKVNVTVNAGKFQNHKANATIGAVSVNGGLFESNQNASIDSLTVGADAQEIFISGNTTTVSGATTSAGILKKTGSGTLTLSGAANLGGINVNNGTLNLNGATTIHGLITVGGNGALSVGANGSVIINNLAEFGLQDRSQPTTNGLIENARYKVLSGTSSSLKEKGITYGSNTLTIDDAGCVSADVYYVVEEGKSVTISGDEADEYYVGENGHMIYSNSFGTTGGNATIPTINNLSGTGKVSATFAAATGSDNPNHHNNAVSISDAFKGTLAVSGKMILTAFSLGKDARIQLVRGEHWSSGGSVNTDILLADTHDYEFRHSGELILNGKVSGKHLDVGTKNGGGTLKLTNAANEIEHVTLGASNKSANLTIAADMAFTDLTSVNSASNVTLEEGVKLTLGSDSQGAAESTSTIAKITVHSAGNTLQLNKSATLKAIDTVNGGGKLTISGSGTYLVEDKATSALTVTLDSAAWRGTTIIRNTAGDDNSGINFSDMGNANSTIKLQGLSGWIDTRHKTVESDIILENYVQGEVQKSAMVISDHSPGEYRFTGAISGSGDFEFDSKGTPDVTYTFSGDTSLWKGGILINTPDGSTNTPKITLNMTGGGDIFSAAGNRGLTVNRSGGTVELTLGNSSKASTMNGALVNGVLVNGVLDDSNSGRLDVVVDANTKNVTFNKAVNINGTLTVQGEGATLTDSLNRVDSLDLSKNNGSTGKLKLKENVTLSVNGNLWGGNNSALLLEKGASLTKGVINIAGVDSAESKQGKLQFTGTWAAGADQYSIGSRDFTISNANVTVASTGNETLGNKLENSSLINDGGESKTSTGKVIATQVGSLVDVKALTGSIELMNLTAGAELQDLQVGANQNVGAYTGENTTAPKASLSVGGTATFGEGASVSANLKIAANATLVIAGTEGVNLQGNALTLGGGVVLGDNLKYNIQSLKNGGSLVLFTGVNTLTLPENANPIAMMADGDNGSPVQADASTVFSELAANTYTITLDNSIVSINMLAVPEPTTATLSLLALAGLAARRRRK